MGRPPKPTAIKILEGNAGKRPLHPEREPDSPLGASPPAWLEPAARSLWDEWAPRFTAAGCLREIHTAAFAGFMITLARIVSLQREGKPVMVDLHKMLLSYATQFAGTPSAMSRVYVVPKKPETKLGKFLGTVS